MLAAGSGDHETSEENAGDAEGERMVSNGKELLGESNGRDHLTNEEIEDLGLTVVTEKGETVLAEQLRGQDLPHSRPRRT